MDGIVFPNRCSRPKSDLGSDLQIRRWIFASCGLGKSRSRRRHGDVAAHVQRTELTFFYKGKEERSLFLFAISMPADNPAAKPKADAKAKADAKPKAAAKGKK